MACTRRSSTLHAACGTLRAALLATLAPRLADAACGFHTTVNNMQCDGLSMVHTAHTSHECKEHCCAQSGCDVWQFCSGSACNHANPCWTGTASQITNDCDHHQSGWVGERHHYLTHTHHPHHHLWHRVLKATSAAVGAAAHGGGSRGNVASEAPRDPTRPATPAEIVSDGGGGVLLPTLAAAPIASDGRAPSGAPLRAAARRRRRRPHSRALR